MAKQASGSARSDSEDDGEYRSGPIAGTALIGGVTFAQKALHFADVDGLAIFEGDIVLGTVEEVLQAGEGAIERGIGITGQQFRWPDATIPYNIDPALPNQQRITDAIAHWQANTPIRLVLRTAANAALYPDFVHFQPGNGCSSRVGRQGGQQNITLAGGCSAGSTIHEISHAVGLWHEQSREDRGTFVRIVWANIDADNQHNFVQHIADGDDLGPYDYGSIMHYSATAFSNNGQATIVALRPLPPGVVMGQRNGLSQGDIAAVNDLYPGSVLEPGTYTVRQRSNGRFMDAHEIAGQDFRLVTRTAQNNDTQRWIFSQVGTVYTIRQRSNGRFVDAHENTSQDFRLVTRTRQDNNTQRWVFLPAGDGSFTIRQLSNGRFVDAHESASQDFRLVTRPRQDNTTQRWLLDEVGANTFTIRQKSNGRYVDAHESASQDFRLVTRPMQPNTSQRWVFSQVGAIYTIRQKSNGRFVDAHESSTEDFRLVTRPAQNNDTQRWVLLPAGDGSFSMQQLSNLRFVDAHDSDSQDFRLVTRPAQDNDTQRWIFNRV